MKTTESYTDNFVMIKYFFFILLNIIKPKIFENICSFTKINHQSTICHGNDIFFLYIDVTIIFSKYIFYDLNFEVFIIIIFLIFVKMYCLININIVLLILIAIYILTL